MSKKDIVKYLQKLLNKYVGSALTVDGIFGAKTEDVLDDEFNQKPHTKNFSYEEFRCKDGTYPPKKYWAKLQELMDKLENLRTLLGDHAITINSGYRTYKYNRKIGGAFRSRHMYADAADISVEGVIPSKVYSIANVLFKNGGVGKYNTFTHVDVRGYCARW